MFIDFFYQLKKERVPVTLNEWMTLMEALAKGLAFSSLTGFYYLARAVLVKNEAHFDRYDLAFSQYFEGIETPQDILEKALEWLKSDASSKMLSAKLQSPVSQINLDVLRQTLEDRLKTQEGERQGGSHWIGSGGTSPLGHSGINEAGMRIGGESVGLSAIKVAAMRTFKDYRDDHITGLRQFEMALRQLRRFSTRVDGAKDELDLNGTVDATCRNAGMLKLVYERPRRNSLKVILLMDSAGSIFRYMQIVSQLFNAAHRATHFKEIKFFYFHNCVYDQIFNSFQLTDKNAIKTEDFFKKYNSEYRLILVGDASMAPSELLLAGGAISENEFNKEPGQLWLKRIARHFPYSVWLNPVPLDLWGSEPDFTTIPMVQEILPMFELTPAGLSQAIKRLSRKN